MINEDMHDMGFGGMAWHGICMAFAWKTDMDMDMVICSVRLALAQRIEHLNTPSLLKKFLCIG